MTRRPPLRPDVGPLYTVRSDSPAGSRPERAKERIPFTRDQKLTLLAIAALFAMTVAHVWIAVANIREQWKITERLRLDGIETRETYDRLYGQRRAELQKISALLAQCEANGNYVTLPGAVIGGWAK